MISNPGSKIKKKDLFKKKTNNKYRSSIGKNKREREENIRLRLALKKGVTKKSYFETFFSNYSKKYQSHFQNVALKPLLYFALKKKKKKIRETPKIKFKLLLNFALKVVEKSNGKSDF